MWPLDDTTVSYAVGVGLLIVNAIGVVLVALQLPGTWLMVVATAGFVWWAWPEGPIKWWTLALLLLLAVAGEVIEAIAGAYGARRAGGTRRGAIGAIVGGIVGAIAGTPLIPVPIVGTVVGACIGAGAGSMLGDRWAGRTWDQSFQAGRGAASGKLLGTIGKLGVAVVMWLLAAIALFAPFA